jgi:hypothetical protein
MRCGPGCVQSESQRSSWRSPASAGRLEDCMLRLETEQTQISTEARSAATAAFTVVAGGINSNAVTRITRLGGRADQFAQRRLPGQPKLLRAMFHVAGPAAAVHRG